MSKKEERRWSDRWKALEVGPGEYALTAGLDRTIDLRGIAPDLGTTLLGWSAGQPITPSTPEAQTLAARLADIGAITMPEFMSIVLMGEDALCAALAPALTDANFTITIEADADLAVLLRTSDGWPETVLPHLAVDPRFHHTLVIGPYVLPGLTTCTDCVDRRIARRWPALDEPEQPAGLSRPTLIAELLAIQLNLISAGTSALANGLISWDLESGESSHTTALMFPGCSTCDPGPASGTIALP